MNRDHEQRPSQGINDAGQASQAAPPCRHLSAPRFEFQFAPLEGPAHVPAPPPPHIHVTVTPAPPTVTPSPAPRTCDYPPRHRHGPGRPATSQPSGGPATVTELSLGTPGRHCCPAPPPPAAPAPPRRGAQRLPARSREPGRERGGARGRAPGAGGRGPGAGGRGAHPPRTVAPP